MNIVLTGFMASGKTTIAKRIEEISNYEFIDTDDMIVEKEGMSINEIFAANGEEYFRNVEVEIAKQVSNLDNKVISTGGGLVLRTENVENLRHNGIIFNLNPEFTVIENRLIEAAKTRPLLKNQNIAEIKQRFNNRQKYYDNCDYKINITMTTTVNETAQKILKQMKEFAK